MRSISNSATASDPEVNPKVLKTTPFATFCIAIHIFVIGGDRDFIFGR